MATLPADAPPQVAGDAEELQLAVVDAFPHVTVPGIVTGTPDLPILIDVAFVVPKLRAPPVTVSINAPICMNKFPAVRVTLEPSSKNRESPRVAGVVVPVNFASLLTVTVSV
jgi:hypothetical protein